MNTVALLLHCTDQGCGSAHSMSLLASCLPCLCHLAPSYMAPRHRPRCSSSQRLPSKACWTRLLPFSSSCCVSLLLPAGEEVSRGHWPILEMAEEGHLAFEEGKSRARARSSAASLGGSLPLQLLPAVSSHTQGKRLTTRLP